MTAIRGLLEAAVLFVGAAAIAAVAAFVWITVGDGGYLNRLGICLIVLGAAVSATGSVVLSRGATAEAYAFMGAGPERDGPDRAGGRVLTGVGVFLFVGAPLVVLGVALI